MAATIVSKAEAEKVPITQSDSFEALAGRGVKRIVGGKTGLLGNRKLMQDQNVSINESEADLSALETQGKTVTILAINGQCVGLIAAMDTVKDSAAEAVQQLKGMNLEVEMLTGDTNELQMQLHTS